MFDAYTIKKVVPKLVIATILIQLSWPIFTFLVYAVGQISWGIEGLFYAPFGGASELGLSSILTNGVSNDAGVAGIFAVGGAVVALTAATIGGALLALLSALLAVLVAFFVLAMRQLVIIALLVVAPLALVAWILPNTEKFWKIWWESFSKLLIMYPLIIVLIAGGKIAAYLAANGDLGGGAQLFRVFLVFIAFFAPYFLIPATFKVAGSAFANITGIANDSSRGVFDRLRKGRQERAKKVWGDRYQRADESRLFNPEGRLGRFNNAASSIVNPVAAAKIKMNTRGGRALLGEIGQAKWDHTEKMAGALSKAGLNDRALDALTSWDGSTTGLDRIADGLAATGDTNDAIGAQQLRNNADFLLNAHRSEEYGRGSIKGAAGLALAAQGFTTPEKIATVANALDSEIGMGLGNTFKTSAELAGARGGALTKPGYSVVWDASAGENGQGAWIASPTDSKTRVSQVEKMGVQDIGASKGLSMFDAKKAETDPKEKLKSHMGDSFVAALSGPNKSERADEVRATLASAYHSYTNPTIRKDIVNVLRAARRKELDNDPAFKNNMSPEQQEQTIARMVQQDLGRGRGPSVDEVTAANQPPAEDEN